MSTAHALIAELSGQIAGLLDPLVKTTPMVALLDFPDHWNVGDSAIYLGETAYLERARGRAPDYTCSVDTYDAATLRAAAPEGPILLHGGGNFGDLYPLHQNFRERVCADFPERRIIQLPQTIHFRSQERMDDARRVFANHRDFTLIARDRVSYELAKSFECKTAIAPDMAFCLGSLSHLVTDPSNDLVALMRSDGETKLGERLRARLPASARVMDWQHEDLYTLQVLARYVATRRGGAQAREDVAQHRMARGLEILASGKRVVTDRLHAHILCLLLGVRHLLLDNSYGKNAAFFESWTSGFPDACFTDSVESFDTWFATHEPPPTSQSLDP